MGNPSEEPVGYFEIGFIFVLLVRAASFKDLAVGWIYQLRVIGGTACTGNNGETYPLPYDFSTVFSTVGK